MYARQAPVSQHTQNLTMTVAEEILYNNGEIMRYSFLNKLPFASATEVLLEW